MNIVMMIEVDKDHSETISIGLDKTGLYLTAQTTDANCMLPLTWNQLGELYEAITLLMNLEDSFLDELDQPDNDDSVWDDFPVESNGTSDEYGDEELAELMGTLNRAKEIRDQDEPRPRRTRLVPRKSTEPQMTLAQAIAEGMLNPEDGR